MIRMYPSVKFSRLHPSPQRLSFNSAFIGCSRHEDKAFANIICCTWALVSVNLPVDERTRRAWEWELGSGQFRRRPVGPAGTQPPRLTRLKQRATMAEDQPNERRQTHATAELSSNITDGVWTTSMAAWFHWSPVVLWVAVTFEGTVFALQIYMYWDFTVLIIAGGGNQKPHYTYL